MRQIFLLIFFFSAFCASAQTSTQTLGAPNTLVLNRGHFRTDSTFQNAVRDTTFRPSRLGVQVYRQQDRSIYVSIDTLVRPYWARVGSTTDSISIRRDSIFVYTRDTVYYVGTYTPIDTANKWVRLIQNNATNDSLIYWIGSTRYAVKDNGSGGTSTDTTSLSNRINLKVNISDTSAMLNPYLRKADTTNKWVNNATLSASGDSLIIYKNGTRTASKITGTGSIDTTYTISTKANVWRVIDSLVASGVEIDSTFWSTRAWRQKGVDSVVSLLGNYLTAETDPSAIKKTGTTTLTGNVTVDGGSNYYTKLTNTRLLEAKGASVAAANNLTLGNDGNSFTITGSTQINAITTTNWQAGVTINLVFTGTPTLKHNTAGGAGTAPLDLAGDVDWTAANGDLITLFYDGTSWKETTRKIAGVNGGRGTVTQVNTGYGVLGGPITSTGTVRVDTTAVQNKLSAGTGIAISGNTIYATGGGGGGSGMAIGGLITSATAGSNLYVGTNGLLQQSNSDWFYDSTNKRVGIGLNSSLAAKLHIKGTGTTSTTYGLQVHNSTGSSNSLIVRDDGLSSFGTTPQTNYRITASGDVKSTFGTVSVVDGLDSVSVAMQTTGTSPWLQLYKRGVFTHYLLSNTNGVNFSSITNPTTTGHFLQLNAGAAFFSGNLSVGTIPGGTSTQTSTSIVVYATQEPFLRFIHQGSGNRSIIGHANASADLQVRVGGASNTTNGTHVQRWDGTFMNTLIGNTTSAEYKAVFAVQATDRGAIPGNKVTTAQRLVMSSGIWGTTYARSGGTVTGGSGYVNGTYTNVSLTGGTGSGAKATVVVSGGAVTSLTLTTSGTGYAVGDVISASNTNLGGTGSGFQFTLTEGHFIVTEGVQVWDTDLHKPYWWNGSTWITF